MLSVPGPEPGWTWLHGASAGEHVAATALEPHIAPCWRTSSSWRTKVSGSFPAPLDLPWVIGPWLDKARPGRLILVEGELWPGWLLACRARSIPVVVVNAKNGRGQARWKWIGPVWRWLTKDITWIPQAETGDLKLSAPLPPSCLKFERPLLIAASTRDGDEPHVLAAWDSLPAPKPMLLIAPRHLTRIEEISTLLDGRNWCLRSEELHGDSDIVLLDTMGELAGLYTQASAVFIGGTFNPEIGGHSPAEAILAGVPIVHGPQTHGNPQAWSQAATTLVETPRDLSDAFGSALQQDRTPVSHNDAATQVVQRLPTPMVPPERIARPWLYPLSILWRLLSILHRKSQDKNTDVSTPTIVVGGLVNGGAGRTPTAGWIAEQLDHAWVISSGYKRGGGSGVRIGRPDSTPDMFLGDELEMLRRQGICVVSAPNRVDGILAAKEARFTIIDGGLGHPSFHRAFTICCIDVLSPTGRGAFPMGASRHPWSYLDKVDTIWLHNHRAGMPIPALPPNIPVVRSHVEPHGWLHQGDFHPLDAVQGCVDVVIGIAKPERFVCALIRLGLQVGSVRIVSDHGDLSELPPGTVITEKDAARLPSNADVWVLKMKLHVHGAEPVLTSIREHV
jgi:3-deoxy-D-manno-octulosonic-acid transferase